MLIIICQAVFCFDCKFLLICAYVVLFIKFTSLACNGVNVLTKNGHPIRIYMWSYSHPLFLLLLGYWTFFQLITFWIGLLIVHYLFFWWENQLFMFFPLNLFEQIAIEDILAMLVLDNHIDQYYFKNF